MPSCPRWILLLSCVAALFTATLAQAASIGAVLGMDRCAISGDAPPNTSYGGGMGWIAGVQGEIALAPGVALSLQPRIIQRSTELKSADEESPDDTVIDLELDYVSVPLLVKFGGGRTYFSGGVDLGFLTGARLSGEGVEEDIEPLLHEVDVGALVGFGVVFPVGKPRLTTEIRYVQGLVNLSDGSQAGMFENLPDRFHSSGLQLTAGILFPLGSP